MRTRAAAIVDEGLKIDLPPDTFAQLQRDGLRASDWDLLLFTHSDDDHLALSELQYALHPFTDAVEMPFPIFANPTVVRAIEGRYPGWPLELVPIRAFDPFESASYRISPVRARHTPGEECLNFLVERAGKRLVYATDTGVWGEETLEYLRGVRTDLFVVECTNALRPSDYVGHLDLDGLGTLLERLRSGGTIDAGTRVVTTHHAAAGGARHGDLVEALAPLGAEPGYDGMLLTV